MFSEKSNQRIFEDALILVNELIEAKIAGTYEHLFCSFIQATLNWLLKTVDTNASVVAMEDVMDRALEIKKTEKKLIGAPQYQYPTNFCYTRAQMYLAELVTKMINGEGNIRIRIATITYWMERFNTFSERRRIFYEINQAPQDYYRQIQDLLFNAYVDLINAADRAEEKIALTREAMAHFYALAETVKFHGRSSQARPLCYHQRLRVDLKRLLFKLANETMPHSDEACLAAVQRGAWKGALKISEHYANYASYNVEQFTVYSQAIFVLAQQTLFGHIDNGHIDNGRIDNTIPVSRYTAANALAALIQRYPESSLPAHQLNHYRYVVCRKIVLSKVRRLDEAKYRQDIELLHVTASLYQGDRFHSDYDQLSKAYYKLVRAGQYLRGRRQVSWFPSDGWITPTADTKAIKNYTASLKLLTHSRHEMNNYVQLVARYRLVILLERQPGDEKQNAKNTAAEAEYKAELGRFVEHEYMPIALRAQIYLAMIDNTLEDSFEDLFAVDGFAVIEIALEFLHNLYRTDAELRFIAQLFHRVVQVGEEWYVPDADFEKMFVIVKGQPLAYDVAVDGKAVEASTSGLNTFTPSPSAPAFDDGREAVASASGVLAAEARAGVIASAPPADLLPDVPDEPPPAYSVVASDHISDDEGDVFVEASDAAPLARRGRSHSTSSLFRLPATREELAEMLAAAEERGRDAAYKEMLGSMTNGS